MDKLIEKIIEWIEYLKKKDDLTEKRLANIEDYLSNSTEEKINNLLVRLEALEEKEGVESESNTPTEFN